ncbi:MAG: hypothetical protein CME13_01070 [Gemmatimonadetes bacterium]|nr:hypothetical protein [Gemmatimonadota bacterium]MDP7631732.1 hypothetical protein [Candidatus Latescibacterota bacterium]
MDFPTCSAMPCTLKITENMITVATRAITVSFVTTDAGVAGFEFVVGSSGEPTLTLRDAQHEYVFTATQE